MVEYGLPIEWLIDLSPKMANNRDFIELYVIYDDLFEYIKSPIMTNIVENMEIFVKYDG